MTEQSLQEKIEDILEPTLDGLYRRNLPEGKYEEVAIKASIGMIKRSLARQILSLIAKEIDALEFGDEDIPYAVVSDLFPLDNADKVAELFGRWGKNKKDIVQALEEAILKKMLEG